MCAPCAAASFLPRRKRLSSFLLCFSLSDGRCKGMSFFESTPFFLRSDGFKNARHVLHANTISTRATPTVGVVRVETAFCAQMWP